jgi:hypothetical protein
MPYVRPKATSPARRRQATGIFNILCATTFAGYRGPCVEWRWDAIHRIELDLWSLTLLLDFWQTNEET